MIAYGTRSLCFVILSLTVTLLLSSCVPASPPLTPAPQPTAAPQVIIQGENPAKEELQTIEIDNCNGKTDIPRTETRSQSIETTISAELAAKLGAQGPVIYGEVQATVGAALGRKAERTSSIQVSAPPGSRMVFQLAWTGPEQLGFVQNLRGSSLPVAFTVFTPTDVRIKNQLDIGCPAPNKQSPTSSTEAHPIVPAQKPSSSFPPPCPGFISRGIVKEWSVVRETNDKEKVMNYLQKFYKVFLENSSPKPVEFHGGDIIPAGRIVATDFGGLGETDVWKNYPLQSVAHYRSWGLFETINDFYVPAGGGGQCLVIVP
jgi:hypothetical protein